MDFGWHANRGADRNAARHGVAYSTGMAKALSMQLSDFDEGKQKIAENPHAKRRVEHLVPRRYACDEQSWSRDLLGDVTNAAAELTSELLKERRPELYAHMQRHAPSYRISGSCDCLWTTGRVAFMRSGAKVCKHRDRENMPGSVGVDLVLSFGEVRGAELRIHFTDGTCHQVSGDKTIFADFLNEHEVSEMGGPGLRLAFVFWQQRPVVLSDHVINHLGAKVYQPLQRTKLLKRSPLASCTPHSCSPAQRRAKDDSRQRRRWRGCSG